jgi:hypothetical protein
MTPYFGTPWFLNAASVVYTTEAMKGGREF